MEILGVVIAGLGILLLFLAIKGGYQYIPPFGKMPTNPGTTAGQAALNSINSILSNPNVPGHPF